MATTAVPHVWKTSHKLKLYNSAKTLTDIVRQAQSVHFHKNTETECSTRTNPRQDHSMQPTKVHEGLTSVSHHEFPTSTLHLSACIEDANTLVNGFTHSRSTTPQTLLRPSHRGSHSSCRLFNQHPKSVHSIQHQCSKDTNVDHAWIKHGELQCGVCGTVPKWECQ